MKLKFILLPLMFIFSINVYAQSDFTSYTRVSPNIGNENEVRQYDNSSTQKPETIYLEPSNDIEVNKNNRAPFLSDWVNPDIRVDSGLVATAGFRQAVLKFGSDNSLYAVINKKTISGQFNGKINIFRSDNGGLNWTMVSSFQSFSGYFGQFSYIIENNTPSVEDSTRIIVFYTLSANQNLNSSLLNVYSVRRNGTAPIQGTLLLATSGFKLFNPSAVSNSIFGGQDGYGVVIGEYNNTTDKTRSLRYLRTTNFGSSFESISLIDPGYSSFDDYFPVASFKKGSTDSVYIAVERRSATDTLIRLISTPWEPTASANTTFLTNGPDNYERPSMTILQTDPTEQIMITSIKNLGIPVYHFSTDGGSSWTIDAALGEPTQKDIKYIACSSDPDITGGGYFIAGYQDAFFSTSDSVTVRRGILGDMGNFDLKRNDFVPTGFISPSVAIYKYTPAGGSMQKRSAVLYVGTGTANAYYDQENLPTGIINNNGIATEFRLSQNYPNPFNPTTKIDFEIPSFSTVKLTVYDMLGKEVATLVNKDLNAGLYTTDFKAGNLASGMYFYRINVQNKSGQFQEVRKMMLIK